jgi:ADP-ribose pyrophosphatase YjhB (NUDIX family)
MDCPRSVSVVIFNHEMRILLHKREDFRIWSLPGGFLNPGENWEAAAVRETAEETGYQIVIERLVAEYSQPQMPNGGEVKYLCTGRIVGGEAIQRGAETVQVVWFDPRKLPFRLAPFNREYVADTLSGSSELVRRTLRMPQWKALGIALLIKLRNFRNRLLGRGSQEHRST